VSAVDFEPLLAEVLAVAVVDAQPRDYVGEALQLDAFPLVGHLETADGRVVHGLFETAVQVAHSGLLSLPPNRVEWFLLLQIQILLSDFESNLAAE